MTKHLLSRYFDQIDINDLLEEYTDQTRSLFTDDGDEKKIDRAFVCSIGDLQFDNAPRYDLIWAQCKRARQRCRPLTHLSLSPFQGFWVI